jgi:hypothetical protein
LFFVILILLSCATNNYLPQANNFTQGEQRFIEETGGFSLMIPNSWRVANAPGIEYKVIIAPSEGGSTPVIVFAIEAFVDSLDTMLDRLLEGWKVSHSGGDGFELVYRGDFVTLNGIKGKKIIFNASSHGQRYQQVHYCFPGMNHTFYAVCTVKLEAGNIFNDRFDRIMETFEWFGAPSF